MDRVCSNRKPPVILEPSYKRVLKREYLNTEQIRRLVDFYINSAKLPLSVALELIIVFNKVEMYSLYWNPLSERWSLSGHTNLGWNKYTTYGRKEFDTIIKKCYDRARNIRIVQCRTNAGVKIYHNKKKTSNMLSVSNTH